MFFLKFHVVTLRPMTPIVEIYKDGVLTVDKMGRKIITNADTVVSAIGRVPAYTNEFADSFKGKVRSTPVMPTALW